MCSFTVLVTNSHNDCGVHLVMICEEKDGRDPKRAKWWDENDLVHCDDTNCRYQPDHKAIVNHHSPRFGRELTCNELGCHKGPYVTQLRTAGDDKRCCGLRICCNCKGGRRYGTKNQQDYRAYYGPQFAHPWLILPFPPCDKIHYNPDPVRHDRPDPAGRDYKDPSEHEYGPRPGGQAYYYQVVRPSRQ